MTTRDTESTGPTSRCEIHGESLCATLPDAEQKLCPSCLRVLADEARRASSAARSRALGSLVIGAFAFVALLSSLALDVEISGPQLLLLPVGGLLCVVFGITGLGRASKASTLAARLTEAIEAARAGSSCGRAVPEAVRA